MSGPKLGRAQKFQLGFYYSVGLICLVMCSTKHAIPGYVKKRRLGRTKRFYAPYRARNFGVLKKHAQFSIMAIRQKLVERHKKMRLEKTIYKN